MSAVLTYTVEPCLGVAGIHRRSLHHSQSQEKGEGEEREGGGEDGSGEWKKPSTLKPFIVFTPFIFFFFYEFVFVYSNMHKLLKVSNFKPKDLMEIKTMWVVLSN